MEKYPSYGLTSTLKYPEISLWVDYLKDPLMIPTPFLAKSAGNGQTMTHSLKISIKTIHLQWLRIHQLTEYIKHNSGCRLFCSTPFTGSQLRNGQQYQPIRRNWEVWTALLDISSLAWLPDRRIKFLYTNWFDSLNRHIGWNPWTVKSNWFIRLVKLIQCLFPLLLKPVSAFVFGFTLCFCSCSLSLFFTVLLLLHIPDQSRFFFIIELNYTDTGYRELIPRTARYKTRSQNIRHLIYDQQEKTGSLKI